MSLVSTTISNLINGVSQQAFALRLPSQCELQQNGDCSVVEGLTKRPPSVHSARISTTPAVDSFVHTINRDVTERYIVIVENGDLQVYDLAGNQKTVTFPSGKGYLVNSLPSKGFAAITVADYTFIVNKGVTIASDGTSTSPSRPYEALVWVQTGDYFRTYTLTVGGTTVAYTTPGAGDATHQAWIQTDWIATTLVGILKGTITTPLASPEGTYTITGSPITTGMTIEAIGSTIHLSSSTDFTLTASDGGGDQSMKAIKGSAQAFTDLPGKGVNGFVCKVQGDASTQYDDYWVQYTASATFPNGGTWKECPMPGELTALSSATMPHTLVRNSDGTFTFDQQTWDTRLVGSLALIPFPSFTGRTMNDVFFYRNRLGFLSDENIIMSQEGEFFNFFRQSAIQLLDDDPIDIATTHTKVSILKRAVPFNETLLLFSDQTQFQLANVETLTTKTVAVNAVTEFECNLDAPPVAAGDKVYFAVNRGGYTGIREFYVDAYTQTKGATDVTAHCPKYIPGGVQKVATTSNEGIVCVLAANDASTIYTYRHYEDADGNKLQSAWSRWPFYPSDLIIGFDFIESDLWVVVSRYDGVYIETISVDPGRADTGGPFVVRLDRRVNNVQCPPTYDAGSNTTSFTVPYKATFGEVYQLCVWYGDTTYNPGKNLAFTATVSGSNTVITVPGRLTSFYFGRQYIFRYRFSTLVVRESSEGGGDEPMNEGRLQLRNMSVAYGQTGYFHAEVTPLARDVRTFVFSGRTLGSVQSPVGQPALQDGVFKFPILAKNDRVMVDLVNDTFLPSAFLNAGWEGFLTIRSKRI